ncbi:MAG: NADH-quinone oxidoreductase subunit N, partial [Sphingomonadaceae bacterium]|nr:NADH-quinone oxidoreductase subunit N [Sphingomonadaceae bacterium]
IVKVMYFDEPAEVVEGKSDAASWVVLALATIFVSPLGFLLTSWLGGWADRAAAALFFAA